MVRKPGQRDAFCKPASGTGGGHAVRVHGRTPPVAARPPSRVLLWATPWPVAHRAPLSMAFSRREPCNGIPFPLPGDRPDPGTEPLSLISPTLADGLFTASATWEAPQGMLLSQRKNEAMLSAATRMGLETLRQGQTMSLTCGI